MKKLLIVLAATSAALFPNMSAAQAAPCVHWHAGDPVNTPDVHVDGTGCTPPFADYIGGCSFVAATDAVAGQGQMTGEIDVEAIVFSYQSAQNPVSATFTCYIKVNGSAQPGASVTASGTVVVVGGGIVSYTSGSSTDHVQLCQSISYSNGEASDECFDATSFEIPPPIIWEIVDPAICPFLEDRAGTYHIPSPVDRTIVIEPKDPADDEDIGGDVYIDGELFFDCPRYETP